MTREETINYFEAWINDYYDLMEVNDELTPEIANAALSALRSLKEED